MKVLLLSPSIFFRGRYPPLNLDQPLFYLYSYLRHHCPDVEVELLDLVHELGHPSTPEAVQQFLRDAEALLARSGFDVVGISCYTSIHYLSTLALARLCKRLNPGCTVVVGGHHPTHVPGDFDLPDKPVDFVVRGDGELALRGIVTGTITRETTPQVVLGGSVPMAERVLIWEEHRYNRTAEVEVMMLQLSRNCGFACAFCPDRKTVWEAMTPAQAISELRRAVASLPRLRAVSFSDPTFGLRKPWRDEFLALLRAADLPLAYACEIRVDLIDKDMMDVMADMTFRVDLGLESAIPEILAIMQKSSTPERYVQRFLEVAAYMNKRRIPHGVNLILNYPGETNRTLDASVAFWQDYYGRQEHYYSYLQAHTLQFYPGGELYDNWPSYAERYGARVLVPDWWRHPRLREDVSAYIIGSRELAESRQIGRPRQVAAFLEHLSQVKADVRAFAPFLIGSPPLPWAEYMIVSDRSDAYLDDKPLQPTAEAYIHTRPGGDLLLYNFINDHYFDCSPATSRLVRELAYGGQSAAGLAAAAPDPASARADMRALVVDLVANEVLEVGLPPPPWDGEGGSARVVLHTTLGDMELELFEREVPELAANFLHLVKSGYYDSLCFSSTHPVSFIEIGSYTALGDGPGYTLPLQASSRPFRRGAVAQVRVGRVLHASRIRIARADSPADAPPQAVFAQVVSGWDTLDRLLSGNTLRKAELRQPSGQPA